MYKANRTWRNGISVYYEDWLANEPDGGNTSQLLVGLDRHHGLQFGDYNVGGDHGFICEKGGSESGVILISKKNYL